VQLTLNGGLVCLLLLLRDGAMQSKLLLACFYLLGMGVVCNWVALLQCQDYLQPLFTVGTACRMLVMFNTAAVAGSADHSCC
jgi:hypothetical protein